MPKLSQKALFGAVALIAALAAPLYLSTYDLNLTGRFLALSLVAMGLVILWGEGGILSLGQGVFFGLGGYVLAMHLKLVGMSEGDTLLEFMSFSGLTAMPVWWKPFYSPVVAILAVLIVPGAVGALFGWLIFRRRIGGVYFALISQALALTFATLLISQQGYTGGFNGLTNYKTLFGLRLGSKEMKVALYYVTVAFVILAFILGQYLLHSRFGKMLRATRDNTNRVRFLGYDPTPYKVLAFTIAAFFSGVSGALFTLHAGMVSPALVGVVPSIEMVIWVAVGGRFSLGGAIAGTLIINFAKDKISTAFPEIWLYMLGAIFIVVVTVMPRGVAGMVPENGIDFAAFKARFTPRAKPPAVPVEPVVESVS